MQSTLLPTGTLQVQDQSGTKRNVSPARIFGLLMMAAGVAGWWYNWHLAATRGEFYVKLCIFGPLGLFGGLLMLLRPEWAGPWRPDSTRAHKASMIVVLGLMAAVSGIDMYLLYHRPYHRSPRPSVIRWSPSMGTPSLSARTPILATPSLSGAADITFLARTYRLGSFNRKKQATWEFVTADETVDNWKTLLTIIDRPDARTRAELDRLAEGIMSTYKSNGGRILMAKTMQQESGAVYNYMVAAFEEPGKQRYELNFVRMSLGPDNAVVAIYAVRITDPQDYRTRAKDFLDRSSGDVGRALANLVVPDISKLPRQPF